MSKVVLTDLASLVNANSAINTINNNNAAIEAGFDNTLSRDGTTPNQMNADIDMNSNDLLNVGKIDAADFFVSGTDISTTIKESQEAAAASASAAATSETNAAASATSAAAAAAEAEAAASSVVGEVDSRAFAISSYHPQSAPTKIRTAGYANPGDGGTALYKKVDSEPDHIGKLELTLEDGTTTIWYELTETFPNPLMVGAVQDGSTDDTVTIEGLLAYCAEKGFKAHFLKGSSPHLIANLTWVDGVSAHFDDTDFLVTDGATTSGFQMTGCYNWHFTGFFKMKSTNPGSTGHVYGINLGTPSDTEEQGGRFSIDAADFSDMARGIQICSASKFRLGHITGDNIYGTIQGGSDQVGSLVTIQASLDWDIALAKCTDIYKPVLYLGPSTFRDNQRGTVGRVQGTAMTNNLASGLGIRSGIDIAVGEVVFDGGYRGVIIDHENSSGGSPDPFIIDRVSVGRAILSNLKTTAGGASIGVYVASVNPTGNPVGRLSFGQIIVTNADEYGVYIQDCTEFTFGTIDVNGTDANGNGLETVKFAGNSHINGGAIISRDSWTNGVRFGATNGSNTGSIDQIAVFDASQVGNGTADAVRSDSGSLSGPFKIGKISYAKTGTNAVADILDAGSDTPQTLVVGDVIGTGESNVVAVYNGASGFQFRGSRLYKSAAPSAGTWVVGDTVWNTAPAAAGAPGWICVTAGTAGTWKAMANLAS